MNNNVIAFLLIYVPIIIIIIIVYLKLADKIDERFDLIKGDIHQTTTSLNHRIIELESKTITEKMKNFYRNTQTDYPITFEHAPQKTRDFYRCEYCNRPLILQEKECRGCGAPIIYTEIYHNDLSQSYFRDGGIRSRNGMIVATGSLAPDDIRKAYEVWSGK